MRFFIRAVLLVALSLTSVIAEDSCNKENALAVDTAIDFLLFWRLFKIEWLAITITIINERSLAERDSDLTCTSSEECLSEKGVPFCYDKATYIFRLADDTTGNFKSGDYVLSDGRKGNFYYGPYPTYANASTTTTKSKTKTKSERDDDKSKSESDDDKSKSKSKSTRTATGETSSPTVSALLTSSSSSSSSTAGSTPSAPAPTPAASATTASSSATVSATAVKTASATSIQGSWAMFAAALAVVVAALMGPFLFS